MPNSFWGWGAHGREKVPGGQTWQGPPLLRQVPVYPLRNGLWEHSGSTHRAVSHPSPLPILPGSSHFLFLLLLPSQHVFIPLTIFPSSPHLDQEKANGGRGLVSSLCGGSAGLRVWSALIRPQWPRLQLCLGRSPECTEPRPAPL